MGEDAIKLFLCGDVMIGRGIDQILPHPSDPRLYEQYVETAIEYVAMAEQRNGPIPRSTDFRYIWGDALEELDRVAPAARIINLETSVTMSDDYMPKGINYRMLPANLPCISAAKIDCCVLANNHVLDWGCAGLEETLRSLRNARIGTAGAGLTLDEALSPCVIDLKPGRVLVFAFATADSGAPHWWSATATKPGIAFLPDLSDATAAWVSERVKSVKRAGDIAVISLHWGGNWGYEIPPCQRSFARRLIESGAADLIHGHSSHHRKAIEVCRGKPIFYGCGDFINDYEGIGGYEDYRTELVLMYFVTLDRSTGRLIRIEMTPFETYRFSLRRVSRDSAEWLKETLGPNARLDSDNHLIIDGT